MSLGDVSVCDGSRALHDLSGGDALPGSIVAGGRALGFRLNGVVEMGPGSSARSLSMRGDGDAKQHLGVNKSGNPNMLSRKCVRR